MKILYKMTGFAALPSVTIVAGLFMVFASAWELQEQMFSLSEGLQSEHGILIFGLVTVLKSLAEMHEGLEELHEGSDE